MDRKEFKKLCGQIRRSKKYVAWKKKVQQRDNLDLKFPNVHHIKPFNKILIENKIESMEDAKKCKELWKVGNGITISRGEHRIIALLERMKYNTPGFLEILRKYIGSRE